MRKRIIAFILLSLTIFSVLTVSASAFTLGFTESTKKCVWGTYGARCELTGYNNKGVLTKNAKVKVTLYSTLVSKWGYYACDIKMTDEKGRVIWAEDDTIVAKKSYQTSRTYKLGKDHSVYCLYFRPSTTEMATAAYMILPSTGTNCKVTICHK